MAVNIKIDEANQQQLGTKEPEKIGLKDRVNNLFLALTRIKLKEKLVFVQHLGIMLKAGISMSAALGTLTEQSENKKFKIILTKIKKDVESGVSLADSLKPHIKVFGDLFINMVESGEISGKLEDVLTQLYIQMKKQSELTGKVKGALTYPAVIVFAMGGIGIFMITVVVPKITSMLQDFNTELPLPTKILIGISNALVNHGILFGIGTIAFILMFVQILRTEKGKRAFQSIILKLPVISPIVKKINIARFARTISSLLRTDIMIIKTFQITANVLGNLHYRQALNEMSEKIKKGGQINEVIKNYPKLFPPVVVQMIMVGEETGQLDEILGELAEFYENEVDQIMNNLPAIIEPILILVLGCAIGAMAVAIIMPMYSITSGI